MCSLSLQWLLGFTECLTECLLCVGCFGCTWCLNFGKSSPGYVHAQHSADFVCCEGWTGGSCSSCSSCPASCHPGVVSSYVIEPSERLGYALGLIVLFSTSIFFFVRVLYHMESHSGSISAAPWRVGTFIAGLLIFAVLTCCQIWLQLILQSWVARCFEWLASDNCACFVKLLLPERCLHLIPTTIVLIMSGTAPKRSTTPLCCRRMGCTRTCQVRWLAQCHCTTCGATRSIYYKRSNPRVCTRHKPSP
jgi:hypothetical protein